MDLQNCTFTYPNLLWLLLPVALVALACLVRSIAKTKNFSTIPVIFFRTTAISFIIIALAGPLSTSSRTTSEVSALLDVSASISAEGLKALVTSFKDTVKDLDATVKIIPFSKRVSFESIASSSSSSTNNLLSDIKGLLPTFDTGTTDIASAISSRFNAANASSLILLSDGFETTGDARAAAMQAKQNGISIFPIVPEDKSFLQQGLEISSLYAPLVTDAKKKEKISVTAKNSFSQDETGELLVFLDDQQIFAKKVTIPAKEERSFDVLTPELTGGLKKIKAVIKPSSKEDTLAELSRWISVKEQEKILLVSGTVDDQRIPERLISSLGFSLESIVATERRNIEVSFENVSTAIINNVPKDAFSSSFLPELEKFVKNGGSLLLIGGDKSFGLGGYLDTKLEEMSPLKFVPPQTKKRRLNTAVVLLLDKSRSMIHQNRILAAKRAAFSTINTLKDDDLVGVIGFDSTPFVLIRLDTVANVKPGAERRLANLTAAGSTQLLPALTLARNQLSAAKAGRKHLIILTDGKLPDAGDIYFKEISKLDAIGATVSTIALGAEADVPFMKLLANHGKGAFYHTLSADTLPELFVKDVKVATGELTLKEKDNLAVRLGKTPPVSTTITSYPTLKGFVETLPKKQAQLELLIDGGENLHPLLASWSFGSGKVTAFTSDANGRWSGGWLSWPGFTKFWSEILNSLKPLGGNSGGSVDFDLRYRVDGHSIALDLAIFDEKLNRSSAPVVSASIKEPGQNIATNAPIQFDQTKKGLFTASIADARPGTYQLSISYGALQIPPLAISVTGDMLGERQGRGLNISLLSDIAFLSGGIVNPRADQLKLSARESSEARSLALPLLLSALILLLVEAFIRERVRFRKR
jgi:uncharacterized membrane protein